MDSILPLLMVIEFATVTILFNVIMLPFIKL